MWLALPDSYRPVVTNANELTRSITMQRIAREDMEDEDDPSRSSDDGTDAFEDDNGETVLFLDPTDEIEEFVRLERECSGQRVAASPRRAGSPLTQCSDAELAPTSMQPRGRECRVKFDGAHRVLEWLRGP